MPERLTWEEIKRQYPDQWVSIIEPENIEDSSELKSGIVIGYNTQRDEAFRQYKKELDSGKKFNMHTFRFTGKIPLIVGLNKLVISDAKAS